MIPCIRHAARSADTRPSVDSFNYELLGPAAFDVVGQLIAASDCYRLTYGNLGEAVSLIGELLAARPRRCQCPGQPRPSREGRMR